MGNKCGAHFLLALRREDGTLALGYTEKQFVCDVLRVVDFFTAEEVYQIVAVGEGGVVRFPCFLHLFCDGRMNFNIGNSFKGAFGVHRARFLSLIFFHKLFRDVVVREAFELFCQCCVKAFVVLILQR